MHKVIIPTHIHILIDKFIESYLSTFINRFIDSGIIFEDLIINAYKVKSSDFLREIYYNINLKLTVETILGRSIKNNKIFTKIFIGNFMLIVEYSENNKEKIRFIENIEFHTK